MSRCTCTPDHECPRCLALIDQAEEARAGRPAYGYSWADLGDLADARAADEFYGREW